MTELLFQKDSYLKEFTATVKAIEEQGIILDKTAFSYRGGGLQSDTGVISFSGKAYKVEEVVFKNGKVLHIVSPTPPAEMVGKNILGKIDWERRFFSNWWEYYS